jgi:hypothetical protein
LFSVVAIFSDEPFSFFVSLFSTLDESFSTIVEEATLVVFLIFFSFLTFLVFFGRFFFFVSFCGLLARNSFQ